MVVGKSEANIKRLLAKCELMAKNDSTEEWKLGKLIYNLEEMIADLKTSPEKPYDHVINSYVERLQNLKGNSQLNSEAVVCLDNMVPDSFIMSSKSPCNESKQSQKKTKEQTHMELRQKLFSESGELRMRRNANEVNNLVSGDQPEVDADLDNQLKYHHYSQEKIADSMLVLAQNIKEISLLAGNIIRKDTQSLQTGITNNFISNQTNCRSKPISLGDFGFGYFLLLFLLFL